MEPNGFVDVSGPHLLRIKDATETSRQMGMFIGDCLSAFASPPLSVPAYISPWGERESKIGGLAAIAFVVQL